MCAASFLPAFIGGLVWKRMNRAAAVSSIAIGFAGTALWSIFIHGDFGVCKLLTGKPNLLPPTVSVTWSFVDPMIIGLPLAIITAIVVALITKPMAAEYIAYCWGGAKPK
jgi:solute:Na+ symporter, SSS family